MSITKLLNKYESNRSHYKSAKYNESQLRSDFIDPLFDLLGWDISNSLGKPTNEREVLVEESLKSAHEKTTKKPDYTFRLFSERKFFVEAKKPSVDISKDPNPAKQIRRYGFTAKLKISVLTNFEHLAIYDCSNLVNDNEDSKKFRVKIYHYTEYEEYFEEIESLIGKASVYDGSFDTQWETIEEKIKLFSVDDLFLEQINSWRVNLANNFHKIDPSITEDDLNDSIQKYINSIVFLRVCEDRDLEAHETLYSFSKKRDYPSLIKKLKSSDKKYNSGLFDLIHIDSFISDRNSYIWTIIEQLYYPESTYSFSVFSSDILGNIYEIFIGSKISIHNGNIELVKKEDNEDRDIVTTPNFIIRNILKRTVSEYCKERSASEIFNIKIGDIACGSGAFLLESFQLLQDILVDFYIEDDKAKLQELPNNTFKLNFKTKADLLTSCIYGIDKDFNAVRAAEFGLLLKLLEGENDESLGGNTLPNMDKNIIFGNSLITNEDDIDTTLYEDINPANTNGLKFDIVVGNPPYLPTERIEQITPLEKPLYETIYKSAYKQYDKYFLFLEKSLSILKPSGLIGYILPYKFMKVSSGKKLRKLLAESKTIKELVYFGANQVFEKKTTYTCLLIAEKSPQDYIKYLEIDNLKEWIVKEGGITTNATRPSDSLSEDTWILNPTSLEILRKLEEKTLPLSGILGPKSIENGIQTSANNIYIHAKLRDDDLYTYFMYKGKEVKIEKELTRPYFKTSNKEDNLYAYKDLTPNTFVIYPYKKVEGKISLVEYEELQKKYPNLLLFLESVKDILTRKKRSVLPKPKNDNEWYRYGRSQGLENCDVPLKIVAGVLSSGYKYSIDRHHTFISSGGTAGYCLINIPDHCKYSAYYIHALLCSKYLEWYASVHGEIFRGGYIARGTKVLKKLPIIPVNFEDNDEKRLHDEIASTQQELINTHLRIELENESSRSHRTLKNKFESLTSKLESLLKTLFDLGVLDSKVPSVAEIYNKNDD